MQEIRSFGFQDCKTAIATPEKVIIDFCARWKVQEFYLFGSILREDFHASSDVNVMNVMVKFYLNNAWELSQAVDMKQELEDIFARKVDLLSKSSIEKSKNWIRRNEILGTARLIYAAR